MIFHVESNLHALFLNLLLSCCFIASKSSYDFERHLQMRLTSNKNVCPSLVLLLSLLLRFSNPSSLLHNCTLDYRPRMNKILVDFHHNTAAGIVVLRYDEILLSRHDQARLHSSYYHSAKSTEVNRWLRHIDNMGFCFSNLRLNISRQIEWQSLSL